MLLAIDLSTSRQYGRRHHFAVAKKKQAMDAGAAFFVSSRFKNVPTQGNGWSFWE